MASVDIASIKKGDQGTMAKLNKFFEINSFFDGPVLSKKDIEAFKAIANDFDQKKLVHTARWYNYVRQLSPCQIAQLPAEGKVVLSSESDSDSSSSGSDSSSGSSSSGSDSSSEDEAAAKQRVKEERWAKNVAKEQSNVVFDLQGNSPDVDMEDLAARIRQIERESLIWAVAHEVVDVAYGIKKLRIGSTIRNVCVDVDDLEGELSELDGVSNVKIIAFQKI